MIRVMFVLTLVALFCIVRVAPTLAFASDAKPIKSVTSAPMPASASAEPPAQAQSPRWYTREIIGKVRGIDMDYQLYWAMSLIFTGFGDFGEYYDTAIRIKAGDTDSWYREWYKTAERMRSNAEKSLEKGHKVSAGEAYVRAAAYYRMADFYYAFNPKDPRFIEAARKCESTFIKGLKLQSVPMEVVEIPYEGTTLRGYLFRSPSASPKAPIIIAQQGIDGWAEETLYVAYAAMKRGYHCLLYNGPGQGLIVREKNLYFRHDWENVLTPVVDFVVHIKGVDSNRIALMGISMSGALVPRAVAYEHRIKACILSPGYYDLYEAFFDKLPPEMMQLFKDNPEEFNKTLKPFMADSWMFNHAMYVFNAKSPADLANKAGKVRYKDDISKIKCDVLIMDGTSEEVLGAGQPKKLYDMLKGHKTYMLFTTEDVGELHCQVGALSLANERMFNWLDERLKR